MARPRLRHRAIFVSFLVMVVAPVLCAAFYLYVIASDQYASNMGFTVRSEEMSASSELLGGLSLLTQSRASDTDVLYEFIQSQPMVERVNHRLDLAKMFSRPTFDPVFAYHSSGTIEDLVDYWKRMVKISYAPGSGLMGVQVRAFSPEDSQAIAQAIVDESTAMINDLSTTARSDATRYAKEELDIALTRLKAAREALTKFRSTSRIVDPSADIAGQMGLLSSLEAQLASAYIDLNTALETSKSDDPRITQGRRRIDVIQTLIEQERAKFGIGGGSEDGVQGDVDYPTLMGEFERLSVDVEYANKAYLAAMASLDTANAEAQRQSRYLATYEPPSLPEAALYPQRAILVLVSALFLLLFWSIGVLVYYSLRDRR
ncbi:MAG: sugar transporter [Paenirhodobacter sp.]|uniref:sugar transporter n=1 Tax=Paenirhodobacter sp. TaxID=1965326 RepID=UPI003D12D549